MIWSLKVQVKATVGVAESALKIRISMTTEVLPRSIAYRVLVPIAGIIGDFGTKQPIVSNLVLIKRLNLRRQIGKTRKPATRDDEFDWQNKKSSILCYRQNYW